MTAREIYDMLLHEVLVSIDSSPPRIAGEITMLYDKVADFRVTIHISTDKFVETINAIEVREHRHPIKALSVHPDLPQEAENGFNGQVIEVIYEVKVAAPEQNSIEKFEYSLNKEKENG
ncbi:MAG: hypothetical protein LBH98_04265 [Chitinispirillales bacterium]|jgi:hypothetical protein|nr:hypothetical protein [Chitinispirillales bacterium]